MAKQPMNNVDAAWLRMEDPTNLMMISGFFQFARPLDFERVRATIAHRLLPFRRFRQRVVQARLPLRPPFWADDPHFSLDAHLHRIALPAPGDEAALKELVNHLASTPVDFTKPLWQFHVIENYGGGSLLFCRLHHCIADGIALMHVMLSLCDDRPDAPWPEPLSAGEHRHRRSRLFGLLSPAATAFATTRKVGSLILEESREMLVNPAHLLARTRQATRFTQTLGRLVLLPPDPKTVFKGELGVSKRTAWSDELPLEDIKTIGRIMGATVNDVLMTLVSGALRRYLLQRGEQAEGLDIRAMVPVNLRPPEQAFKLGNHFGLVVMALPIGIGDPLERLLVVKKRMDDLKNSPEAVVGFTILQAMGLAPAEIEELGVHFFAAKASLVLTNVPGPRQHLYFAGERIERVMFWVPQSGRMGMGISIFSYAGNVVVGVITDANLVPDPEQIVRELHTEFALMKTLVRQVEANVYRGEAPIAQANDHGLCKAMTQAGRPCRNKVMAGSAYCYVHARMVADSEDMARMH
jgi:WS/DGAT/MGAT family acyltransferase